jgi:hypothetical protein
VPAGHGRIHRILLLVEVLERFTARMIERQRAMYAAETPFIEKWRQAMRFLVADDVAYEKIWLELQALAWNHPDLRERIGHVNNEWRSVLLEAFEEPHREYDIPMPLEALVSLVMTFNEGVILERLSGIETGHAELLEWIDGWLERKENERWRQQKR